MHGADCGRCVATEHLVNYVIQFSTGFIGRGISQTALSRGGPFDFVLFTRLLEPFGSGRSAGQPPRCYRATVSL